MQTLFSKHLDSQNPWKFSLTSHENGPSRGVGEREIFNSFRKKTLFQLVCMNVLLRVDKKALCSMRVLKFG